MDRVQPLNTDNIIESNHLADIDDLLEKYELESSKAHMYKTPQLYSNKETEGRNEHNMFHIGRRGRVGGTKIRLLSSTGRFPKT